MSSDNIESLKREIGQLGRLNADFMRERAKLRKDEDRLDFLMSAFNDQSPKAWYLLDSLRGRKSLSRELIDEAMERSAAK